MRKNKSSIPVNIMADHFDGGIAIERMDISIPEETELNTSDEARRSHREDRHSFFLLERGAVTVEIDFQQFGIIAPSVVYMHPDQVHRILKFENVVVTALGINNESLNAEYLKLLESLKPAKPLALEPETFAVISEAVSLCIKFSQRKSDKLYHSLLKDSCNALVALFISQYLALAGSPGGLSRSGQIADAFRLALESNFGSIKSPALYARKLNISTPYLNDCVKNVTGHSVSHHILQRIVLEAKRLLHHSGSSVKEIASALGYDDYPYFSKLFTKAAGMTPLAFRNKNLA